jgi:hypothetical protein
MRAQSLMRPAPSSRSVREIAGNAGVGAHEESRVSADEGPGASKLRLPTKKMTPAPSTTKTINDIRKFMKTMI